MSSPASPGGISLRGVAVVGVRVLALYLVAQSIVAFSGPNGPSLQSVTYPLVLGVVLWSGVHLVVDSMLPARRGGSVDRTPADAGAVGHLIFAALGLFIVARGAGGFVAAMLAAYARASEPDWMGVAVAAVPLIAGLFIFFGAKGITRLVLWSRHAGRSHERS